MTCTDNDEYATKLRYLRTHGQTGKYLHTMLGLNYRMTDVEAAIGREQLKGWMKCWLFGDATRIF